MDGRLAEGVIVLDFEDAELIRGGTVVRVVAYLAASFRAGFHFGYTHLGPVVAERF